MEFSKEIVLSVNGTKSYLSSETKFFKTERFFFDTKKIADIDKFVLEIAEELQTIVEELISQVKDNDLKIENGNTFFKVETLDKRFAFLFAVGASISKQTNSSVLPKDIIFFEDVSHHEGLRTNDQCVVNFMKRTKIFSVVVTKVDKTVELDNFKKLYHLNSSVLASLPLLSKSQQELVLTENKNMMVQGVAGSGKTNICISKIIFAASRNYSGKVLYTTFSRGLLIDTKNKLELFKNSIKEFIEDYGQNRLVFLDKNRKKAIENRLGLYFEESTEENILNKLKKVVEFLETHVDYYLIEDIYAKVFGKTAEMADEKTFTNKFLKQTNNHQLTGKLSRLKNISAQIVYKEIYGMICGNLTPDETELNNSDSLRLNDKFLTKEDATLSLKDYTQKREGSFASNECEIIYSLAKEYQRFKAGCELEDNNTLSRKLLLNLNKLPKYSLSILDEVQDFTQINLKLFERISLKMLCVGDALQMINPSYFNFSFLKSLMYKEEITDVCELEHNYRNNKKIAELLDKLSEINTKEFGTHSFVLNAKSIDQTAQSSVIFTNGKEFLNKLKNEKFENFTIIASDEKSKQVLRNAFPRQEVLTVSEIKGLERDTVLMVNILSDNKDKWNEIERIKINHKQADENSVYRYYFNLFYVGLSRAKHNIFVFEETDTKIFSKFFEENFEKLSGIDAFERFTKIIGKIEIDDAEILRRIDEFIKLGQFDNARFYAEKFDDATASIKAMAKIDAFEEFVFKGKNREAGIKLWKAGLVQEAKLQFEISGDKALIDFLDNLENKNMQSLDIDVVKFFADFEGNKDAQSLIVDIVKQDLKAVQEKHKFIKEELQKFKEKK